MKSRSTASKRLPGFLVSSPWQVRGKPLHSGTDTPCPTGSPGTSVGRAGSRLGRRGSRGLLPTRCLRGGVGHTGCRASQRSFQLLLPMRLICKCQVGGYLFCTTEPCSFGRKLCTERRDGTWELVFGSKGFWKLFGLLEVREVRKGNSRFRGSVQIREAK